MTELDLLAVTQLTKQEIKRVCEVRPCAHVTYAAALRPYHKHRRAPDP